MLNTVPAILPPYTKGILVMHNINCCLIKPVAQANLPQAGASIFAWRLYGYALRPLTFTNGHLVNQHYKYYNFATIH